MINCAKLPWKEHHPPLLVRSLVKCLAQTPGLLQLYDGRSSLQRVNWTGRYIQYIKHRVSPHYYVKKNSVTTPIRVVLYLSSIQKQSFFLVYHSVMIISAISSPFSQVFALHLSPWARQKHHWLANPIDPQSDLQVYRFKTVLFRASSSPFHFVCHTVPPFIAVLHSFIS